MLRCVPVGEAPSPPKSTSGPQYTEKQMTRPWQQGDWEVMSMSITSVSQANILSASSGDMSLAKAACAEARESTTYTSVGGTLRSLSEKVGATKTSVFSCRNRK